MRKILVSGFALAIALGLAAPAALAGHITRTQAAPPATATSEQQIGWGFYTCVHVMYQYGRARYGNTVSDDILFRAAYDVCST